MSKLIKISASKKLKDSKILQRKREREGKLDNGLPDIMYPANILVIGKRYAGKTTLIKKLLDPSQFDDCYIFSNNVKENNYDFCAEEDQFETCNEAFLEEVISISKEHLENEGKILKTLLLFDDFIGMRGFNPLRSNALRRILSSGRHKGISVVFSTQELVSVPTLLRKNVEAVFMGNMIQRAIDQIGEEYGGVSMSKSQIKEKLQKIARERKYDFLYYIDGANKWGTIPGSVKSGPK